MSDTPHTAASPRSFRERVKIAASLLPPISLGWLAARLGGFPLPAPLWLGALTAGFLIGLLLPGVFVGWYGIWTRGQRWLGVRLLAGLLGGAFVLAILPVGLWLRVRRRSFLDPPTGYSYWVPVRPPGSLKNQY